MEKLTINNIEINVVKKRQKHIYLSISPTNGNIRISVPTKTKDYEIEKLILSKIDWIKIRQDKIKKNPLERDKKYIQDEIEYYEGKEYILNILKTIKKPNVEIYMNQMNLYIKEKTKTEKKQEIIEKWYKKQLEIKIKELIQKWTEIIQVKVNSFNIRKMKTRWGSCNIKTKHITLNLELVKKKPQCLEYVVVHEIIHLLEKHHNSNFKNLMTKYLPTWKQCKKELNKIEIIDNEIKK